MIPLNDHIFHNILQEHWGYDAFRGIQLDIIRSIAQGHDTLGLMPTGGGKSISFQVPALALEGMCLVISPLIALMKDQVDHLRQRGIAAAAIYSGMEDADIQRIVDNAIYDAYKLLYISPERLASERFREKLARMRLSFLVVDEAHCISQWGFDFRPPYRRIAEIRQLFPELPILALTATATPKVVEDICQQLAFRSEHAVYRMSFERKNLSYVVREVVDKDHELLHILRSMRGSAIVYANSRKKVRDLAKYLKTNGITATYYHAGLTPLDKDTRQQLWQRGEVRVMVATNAFGMGIDKPDVRLVVHFSAPDSIEAYFQEAGRAGRDGQRSYAVLLTTSRTPSLLLRRIEDNYPEKEYIRNVYEHLCYYYQLALGDGFNVRYEFDIHRFCYTFHFFPYPVYNALQLLMAAGYIQYEEDDESSSRILMLLDRNSLYSLRSSPEDDLLLNYLFRNYTGIFADYVFINEGLISQQLKLPRHRIYSTFKRLNAERVLHYIPQKNIPHITFSQRRLPKEELVFSPEVYDLRKAEMQTRVEAMIHYITTPDECRSRMLIAYFGQKDIAACGCCDTCLTKKRQATDEYDRCLDYLLQLLRENPQPTATQLHRLPFSEATIHQVLDHLLNTGNLTFQEGMYTARLQPPAHGKQKEAE